MIEISSPFISGLYGALYSGLIGSLGPSLAIYASLLLALIAFALLLLAAVVAFIFLFSWLERKFIARIQNRRGPMATGKYGLLQSLADFIKLLSKEEIALRYADNPIFKLSLPALMVLFFLMVAFLPLSGSFVGISTTLGLLVVMVLLSFSPIFVFLAGWTSGNKFASIGAQRSIITMISYEIPLLMIIAAVGLMAKSFNLYTIVSAQSGLWFALLMPLGFVLTIILVLLVLERPPFDFRNAESELVAGWLTDSSPPHYALAMILDYLTLFFGSLLISLLFLGGYLGPAPIPQFIWLMLKVFVVALLITFLKSFMVRTRVDALLKIGWLYLLPLSVLNLILSFAVLMLR